MIKFGNREEIKVPINVIEKRIGQVLEFNQMYLKNNEKRCPYAPLVTKFQLSEII
jgi:hypothetical protein